MKKINRINKFILLGLTLFLTGLSTSFAMPAELACKLYGPEGSGQMYTENDGTKTRLVFNYPVAFYEVGIFELVYSSGYDPKKPLIITGNSISANGSRQTVEIVLDPASASRPSTRYGKVRAGDLIDNWFRTLGKNKKFDIQCFNF